MAVLDWLLRNTPRETDPAPLIQTNRPAIPLDAIDEAEPATTSDRRYILEPYFVMIEYRDSGGAITQRRVTMRHVDQRGPVRYLSAICHERNALRSFRLDRINCFITQDGEIEDAAAWFAEILPASDSQALAPSARQSSGRATPTISAYTALRREITPGLIVLIAAARSDEILHPRELDRILRYTEDEAFDLRDAGKLTGAVEAEEFTKLDRTIRRLRPTTPDLIEAFGALAGWDASRKRRLAHALAETARADGRVDDIEAQIIADLIEIGGRHHGFGWEE